MSDAADDRFLLAALQRESAMVNDLNGVKAFCVGAFHEILRARTVEDARTCLQVERLGVVDHALRVKTEHAFLPTTEPS